MATSVNMEANGEPLSQSYDSSGQEIQVNGKEARITYSVVDIEGGGEKFKWAVSAIPQLHKNRMINIFIITIMMMFRMPTCFCLQLL